MEITRHIFLSFKMMALLSAVISLSSCGKAPKEKEKNEIYAVSARVFTPLKCDPAKGIIPEMEESMKNELPRQRKATAINIRQPFGSLRLLTNPANFSAHASDEEISKFLEENKSTVIADCDYKTSVPGRRNVVRRLSVLCKRA